MSGRTFDPARPERMDVPQPVSRELEKDLANLATLNRVFGSHALVLGHLRRRLLRGRTWRILDLATGGGDIPRAIASWASRRAIDVAIDAVDQQASTLEIARRLSATFDNITFHRGDIRDFGDGQKWDVVLCSLALHHFSEEDAVRILRRCAALAQHHALVADLRRCAAGTLGVDLLTSVWMREPMTVADARTSVRRAFSFDEFAALADSAGWRGFGHARKFCFRQALWLDR
ncbi:MAG: methyltransferase domain-containing protein [Terrimicrobiaceae bacterium]|nr:methyltransferase domain-containing protein [Terrimicrobiaceae bacterium]